MKNHLANLITSFRIVCSIALLFLTPLSRLFLILYILAGLSDMVDGAAARKMGTVSAFGSKLDTAADLVLTAVCLIKILPVLALPTWLIVWIIVIAAMRAINLLSGYVMHKELVILHTAMNKLTGLLLFILPLTLSFVNVSYSGAFVSAVATFAAVQEGHYIRTKAVNNDPSNRA